ncbi:hypothetical protein CCMA1212_009537 [Trichoderma ghanense]|uniref:Uncharacterized protein n=1 Tax=Trichoderma ghanense TaxID=65468 RepID=A0ABY2GS40_9HYPO
MLISAPNIRKYIFHTFRVVIGASKSNLSSTNARAWPQTSKQHSILQAKSRQLARIQHGRSTEMNRDNTLALTLGDAFLSSSEARPSSKPPSTLRIPPSECNGISHPPKRPDEAAWSALGFAGLMVEGVVLCSSSKLV